MSTEPVRNEDPKNQSLPEALLDPEVQERLGLVPLRFNLLAHQPFRGDSPLTTADVARVRLLLPAIASGCRVGSPANVAQALAIATWSTPYYPVADYLAGLEWDGQERIERIATEVLSVEEEHVAAATSLLQHWFALAAQRGENPGRAAGDRRHAGARRRTPIRRRPRAFLPDPHPAALLCRRSVAAGNGGPWTVPAAGVGALPERPGHTLPPGDALACEWCGWCGRDAGGRG